MLLEDLHAKFPDNPAVANNYASVLSRLGQMDRALEIVRDGFAQHPEYVFGSEMIFFEQIGDRERAQNTQDAIDLIQKQFGRKQ